MFPNIDRRAFSRRLLGLTALTATVPAFLARAGRALAAPAAARDDRVLVVVQLAGGNDGLNTLVPHGDDLYHKARPKLAISDKQVLAIDKRLGFHPEMAEMKKLFDDGRLAVATNVGYPNPSRSHFRSEDIWETASPADKAWTTGWLGRYFDASCKGVDSPMLGLRLGERPALAFAAREARAVTLANPKMLEVPARGPAAAAMRRLAEVEKTGVGALDFVQRSANATRTLAEKVRDAVRDVKPDAEYLPFAFQQSLKLVAQMVAAGLPTRIYYVTLPGFDHHAGQANRHRALLQELSQGLGAFHKDLKAKKLLDRVLVMTFSEFGRRVAENRQEGTDHGTANVMFLMGGKTKPGLNGDAPDLKNLDGQGDLVHKRDFRTVYAAVLRNWLRADADGVLSGKFAPADLVAG